MPELFQKMYYGPNVQNLVESDDCKVMRLSDNSGEGMMTLYHVFPGVFLMYNDFHMKECVSGFQTDMDLLCIDHCREGRIEQEVGQNAFSYLEAGDLRVDRRIHHSGKVEFPLCHYHGISIGFQVETAAKEIPASMKGFSVDLYELQKKYCSDRTPYVIPGEPAIEHIFSELYNVPVKIKKDYFKIKVLELLLYLDALELPKDAEKPYFYKSQVEKVKAIHRLLTGELERHYTIAELSERFSVPATALKECFKSIYGQPINTYMRNFRLDQAALLLQQGDGVAEKLLALRRELHAPVAAGQHPNAQFVLKLPHRRGNPRLGQEQLLGRLVDGAAFGDLHDVLKLLKRHRKPPLPLSISLFYYRHFELIVKSLSKKLSTHPAKRILTALRPLCYSISRTKQKISVI